MSNKMKKSVDFTENRTQSTDAATKVDNQLVSELLLSHLSGKEKGDLIEIALPKDRILKLEILEEGLYSGYIMDAENNDIIHQITKQTFQQLVDNIVANNVQLQQDNQDKKQAEIKDTLKEVIQEEKDSEKVEKPTQIVININLSKAVDEFINMSKSHNKETHNMEQAKLKELVKSIMESLPEEINEDAMIKSYEQAKELLGSKKAIELIKSIADQKYPKPIKKAEDKKVFAISEDNDESIAKSIESLKEIGNDLVDFAEWDDDLTSQQEIIKSNIEKNIDFKKSN